MRVPPAVDFSCIEKVPEPVAEGDTAADVPPPAPYVTVSWPLEARLTPETVIVCPATETVPVEAVVYPADPDVVDGADHPVGAVTVTAPDESPPAAAVYVKVNVVAVESVTEVGATVAAPDPFAAAVNE